MSGRHIFSDSASIEKLEMERQKGDCRSYASIPGRGGGTETEAATERLQEHRWTETERSRERAGGAEGRKHAQGKQRLQLQKGGPESRSKRQDNEGEVQHPRACSAMGSGQGGRARLTPGLPRRSDQATPGHIPCFWVRPSCHLSARVQD